MSVMSSYNSYDGIPVVSDPHILTDILRGEWGYEYYVISDAGGTARLDSAFHVCGPKDHECITLEVTSQRPKSSSLERTLGAANAFA
jgi:beta-glucosidase